MMLATGLAPAGCAPADYTAAERYDRGLVVVLDGAGGITRSPDDIKRGLYEAGVTHAMETFNWSEHDILQDQTDLERNRRKAAELADRLARYVAAHPDCPVHLIGISAGTGIVIFAAEALPDGCRVDGICLLASSLNAGYDLSPAMRHVRNEITNFTSALDIAVLAVGVTVTGTVDRSREVSAGLYGFHLPGDASHETRLLYERKLIEVPWHPGYVIHGHMGHHLGASSSAFVRQKMGPIVLDAERRRGRPVSQ